MTPDYFLGFSRRITRQTPAIGKIVRAGGADIHYIEAGRSDAPALVLLHGASGNVMDWTSSVFDRLAADWRVIAFDRPGYGHSSQLPRQSWLIAPQVHALRSAMAALGYRHYAICGHSYGVAVALEWALHYPNEVTGLLAMSGAQVSWEGALGWRYRWGGKPLIGRVMGALVPLVASDSVLERELIEVFAPQPVPRGYVDASGVRLALRPETFALNLRAMDTLYAQTQAFLPEAGRISCPCEVLHGSADEIVPFDPASQPVAALIPHTHTVVLEGVGHMPHHARPEAVVQAAGRVARRITLAD